jgi:pyridoxine 5-phosphate synthase
MIKLNVNIDHVATLRQARGGNEPDPVIAAVNAELAGASGIVCHLREDRRHIQDRDVKILRDVIQTKMDLEMSATEEIIRIALETKPELVTIVPEHRMELTTEGGLDAAADVERFRKLCDRMHNKNIDVSLFIEPDERQIETALSVGADMVEFHTGGYANAIDRRIIESEWNRLNNAAQIAHKSGLMVAMGHGLNYFNTKKICIIKNITELSIGHSIISRAIFVGISQAVKEMLEIINSSTLQYSK